MAKGRKKALAKGLRVGARSIPNIVLGGTILSVEQNLLPDFAGPYQGAVDKIIVGGADKYLLKGRLGQGDLFTEGIIVVFARITDQFIMPQVINMLSGIMPKELGVKLTKRNGQLNLEAYSTA